MKDEKVWNILRNWYFVNPDNGSRVSNTFLFRRGIPNINDPTNQNLINWIIYPYSDANGWTPYSATPR